MTDYYTSHTGSYSTPHPSYTTPYSALGVKQKLVDSFKHFTGNTVSQGSLATAKQCLVPGVPQQQRYSIIQFDKYLDQNKVSLVVSSVYACTHTHLAL